MIYVLEAFYEQPIYGSNYLVIVEADSSEEAIDKAKRQFVAEWPVIESYREINKWQFSVVKCGEDALTYEVLW